MSGGYIDGVYSKDRYSYLVWIPELNRQVEFLNREEYISFIEHLRNEEDDED